MQQPNALLTTLSKMTLKPEVTFDKLFQKLYNIELWLLAYQQIAPKPGNMTPGVDGKTIDGAGLKLIQDAIADLQAVEKSNPTEPSTHFLLAQAFRATGRTQEAQSEMKSFTLFSYSAASSVKRARSMNSSIALFLYAEMLKIELLPCRFQKK